MLLGGLIGSIFGFEGFVNIPEGEKKESIQIRNTHEIHKLDFEIRCDDFNLSFYDSGAPKEYRSSLTILENGKPVVQKDIIVNDPLHYKGINVFQSSYGMLPSKEFVINFISKESGMNYKKKAMIGQEMKIPEGMGTFVIKDYMNSYNFMDHNIGETLIGILTPNNIDPVKIILPLRFPNFDKMRKGDFVISVADYKPRYYTGLQVTKDPGVGVVYSGFIMIIIGCFIAFFMSHQRLFIEVEKGGKKCKVMVSGTSNKNKLRMKDNLKEIAKNLAGL
jgi:cytochrome c biogenesis protein